MPDSVPPIEAQLDRSDIHVISGGAAHQSQPLHEVLIPILRAIWEAQAELRDVLDKVVRKQLIRKMPEMKATEIERLIERQITTEQGSQLVGFFWLLEASGCALPRRMERWIERYNMQTTQMWTELLLERAIKATKLPRHQQDEIVAKLRPDLGKVRRRVAAIHGYGTRSTECLKKIDTADRLLRELVASNARLSQREALLGELEVTKRRRAPPGPPCRRRLEGVICDAYFSPHAKRLCTKRLDGSRIVLSQSDLERFMLLHMDPKLCRDRLDALAEGGLLESEWLPDEYPAVRLFRSTELLQETVVPILERLCAQVNRHRHRIGLPAQFVPVPGSGPAGDEPTAQRSLRDVERCLIGL